jgi:hypothetical protein
MRYQVIDMKPGRIGEVLEERRWQDLFGATEFIRMVPDDGTPGVMESQEREHQPWRYVVVFAAVLTSLFVLRVPKRSS